MQNGKCVSVRKCVYQCGDACIRAEMRVHGQKCVYMSGNVCTWADLFLPANVFSRSRIYSIWKNILFSNPNGHLHRSSDLKVKLNRKTKICEKFASVCFIQMSFGIWIKQTQKSKNDTKITPK